MYSHYEHLEIVETATDEQIKKAYRKMAMKWHPDRNSNSKEAEEKFKEIKLAYETLSNPHKRKMYDFSMGAKSTSFKEHSSKPSPKQAHQAPSYYEGSIDIQVGFWEAIFGCKKTFDFIYPNSKDKQVIVVSLPAGTNNGEQFIYEKEGLSLTLNIYVEEDDKFTRNNLDLFVNIEVPFSIAALGGPIVFPHWNGEYQVNIPSGIKSMQKVLMPNMGVKRGMFIGDLYLICNITVPRTLTSKQKVILEEFQKTEVGDQNKIFEALKTTWKKFFKS